MASYGVKELKQLIKSLKDAGIGVVLDVVYNHTYKTAESDFNKIVPGYIIAPICTTATPTVRDVAMRLHPKGQW